MPKIIKIPAGSSTQNNPEKQKKAVVFGLDPRQVKQMSDQLIKAGVLVKTVTDENKLLLQLEETDPDLIFLEIEARTRQSSEDIVADIFVFIRNRARAINKFLNSPSGLLWARSRVILYRTETTTSPTESLGADIADTEEVLRKCSLLGEVRFIGFYSPMSFISKVRPYLEE